MGNYREITGLTAGSLNAFLLPATDVSSFKVASLHILTNAYSGTLSFFSSNDGVNFVSTNAVQPGFSNPVSSTGATNVMFWLPCVSRYLAIQMTNFVSGQAQAIVEFYENLAPLVNLNANVSGGNVGVVNGANQLAINASGNITVVQGNASAGGLVTQWGVLLAQHNAPVAVGAGNTVVKGSAANLCTIVVNTAGTTGFTVFDNATTNSGTQLYNSKTAPALGDIYLIVGGAAANGITVANTATGPALTVFYT